MSNNWYKKIKEAAGFGSDPFGSGELTDKVRVDPHGFSGGQSNTGVLEPSSGNSHANDYFSESDKSPSIEKMLDDKKKKKKRLKIRKKTKIKSAQNEESCDSIDHMDIERFISIGNSLIEYIRQNRSMSSHDRIALESSIKGLEWVRSMNKEECEGSTTLCDLKSCFSAEYIDALKNKFETVLQHQNMKIENGELIEVKKEDNYPKPKPEYQREYTPSVHGLPGNWYKQIYDLNKSNNLAYIFNIMQKKAQWGSSGPDMPSMENPPSGGDWVTETFQKMTQDNSKNILKSVSNATVVINSIDGRSAEVGSGFFIGSNTILTCAHVVLPNGANSEQSVKISIKQGGKELKATIFAYDLSIDAAVLVVEDPQFNFRDFLNLGDSDSLEMGDKILIVGTPLGFENVVEQGIISSNQVDYNEGDDIKNYIFVSTKISPGNSGGPVVLESEGRVIGIAAAVISMKEQNGNGLNAAIPINSVKHFLQTNGVNFS